MATTTTKEQPKTKVVIPARFSYAHVWEKHAIEEGGKEKFSVSLLISKDDKALVEKINAAIEAARQDGKTKWGGKIPAKLKMPLRDGDEERPDDEAYKGMYFINANSDTRPQIVDKALNAILEKDDFYSGCYGRASVNFYPFDAAGNKGVAAGLGNLQKLKDGEPLSGRSNAEDDFGDLEDEDDDFMY